jgi:hypothetical protein
LKAKIESTVFPLMIIGIEELGNGIWKVFYRNVFLGFFDEKELRNKQKSIRLETNLV